MSELKIVKVAVENTALSFDALFDYSVPAELASFAEVGRRVLVPFGRANIKKIGMIFEVCDKAEAQRLKSVTAVLDGESVMSKEQLDLAKWIAQNTFCPLYEAVKVQLPSGMHLRLTECYEKTNAGDLSALSEEELRIYREIAASEKPLAQKKLLERFGFVNDEILKSLLKAGVVRTVDTATKTIGDKTIKSARLCEEYSEDGLTAKQMSVVNVLLDVGQASVKDVCYFTGVTPAVLNTLSKKGVVELFDEEVLRVDALSEKSGSVSELALSKAQNEVFEGLKEEPSDCSIVE